MKFMLFSLCIFFFPTHGDRCVERVKERLKDQREILKISSGWLMGKRETDIDPRKNKTVSWTSFYVGTLQTKRILGQKFCLKDIPYAQPPVGDLRFHPPVSADHWSCVRDASFTEDTICPQIRVNITLSGLVNGGLDEASNEDCLYLNVYVPDTDSTGKAYSLFF